MKKIINFVKGLFLRIEKKDKMNVFPSRPLTDDEFNNIRVAKEKKMNSILDKISKTGYDSLSQNEKNFLNNLNG